MNSAQQTTSIFSSNRALGPGASAPTTPLRVVRVRYLALGAVMALSAVLNTYALAQNGWANIYYSADVKSMLHSLHNFLFASFDPGGLISVDKPPLGLWVQLLSAKVFGFTPLSLLLPEAIAGVLAVAALYWVVAPRFGTAAGIASALALAVFPSFVAVSRDNNLDAVLILLMILACGVGLRAIETGRLRALLGCAVLVGLAFNTKALAAYLVLPGLGLGYLLCAPGTLARRGAQLLAAAGVLLAVSVSWSAIVELTPAAQRPFVGGSINNTERGLTLEYNGFGRVEGQVGGPGRIPRLIRHGSLAHIENEALAARAAAHSRLRSPAQRGIATQASVSVAANPPHKAPPPRSLPNGRAIRPAAFGGATGPLRLFGGGLGSQGAWMLPFALLGLVALALWLLGVRGAQDPADVHGRRDPRLAATIVLGGWLLVEAAVLSFSHGIVHPYYVSALGPGVAAMIGAGAAAFVGLGARRGPRLALIPIAVAATVAVQLVLLHHDHYMRWFWPVLIAGGALCIVAILALRRFARQAMALTLGLLLLAPAAYAATTWEVPAEGTFPAAGPRAAGGYGGFGVSAESLRITKSMLAYVSAHRPGSRFELLTEASDTAAPMILLGYDAGAMGGYSAGDPALDGRGLARLVRRGEARYVALGGAYAERGGNAASTAVLDACAIVPAASWQIPLINRNKLLLYDCRGYEGALRRAHTKLSALG